MDRPERTPENPDWRNYGACRHPGLRDLFFTPDGERGPAKTKRNCAAKVVCHRCPVMTQCRRYALSVGEPYGVWGGMDEQDRSCARSGGLLHGLRARA